MKERTQIGVIVGGGTKARLLKAMEKSGRTLSNEAVSIIYKAFIYEKWLAAPIKTPGDLERNLAELHRYKTLAEMEQRYG